MTYQFSIIRLNFPSFWRVSALASVFKIQFIIMPKRKSSSANGSDGSPRPSKRKEGKAKEEKSEEKEPEEPESIKETIAEQQVLKTTTKDGLSGNLKIVSWNCAGLKAWVKKKGVDYLTEEDADIVCLQETKCEKKDVPAEVNSLKPGGLSFVENSNKSYHMYWSSGEKKGYSGTAILTKTKPLKVTYGLGIKKHDNEGRLITAEYDKFFLVTSYVPNSGRGLVRLDYRQKWDEDLSEYLKKLDEKKPIIFCGDLNVAHTEKDIANPKSNKRSAGFTQEERDGFTALLDAGFIDSFRHLNPDRTGAYSFWTYMANARARNVGWRLDYFVLSKALLPNLCDSVMRSSVQGSDHCPIVLMIHI